MCPHLPECSGDVWQKLSESRAPVVMYGTGNGADKLLTVFARYGIRCAGFFASDGFVRHRTFHGMPVLSYEQAVAQFGPDMVIAVGFASNRPEVTARIEALSRRHTLYMPPVPVAGSLTEESGRGGIFDADYVRRHRQELEAVSSFFLDEISLRCYNNIIAYRLSGDIRFLTDAVHPVSDCYDLLHSHAWRCCVDLGAYNGDTLREMAHYAPGLREVIAAEPDPRTYRKLCDTARTLGTEKTTLYQKAAWNCSAMLDFAAHGSRGSAAGQGKSVTAVEADTPDRMIGASCPDYIKYDVEGAERQALLGSIATIRRCQPALLISLYHRTEDLFALPLLLHQICPSYRFYLRRGNCLPDWEIQLLAFPDKL